MLTEHFNETLLPNQIRIVTEEMPHSHSVTIGIWVQSGPKHETPAQAGISHFVEHMLFKGTTSRTARQINESLYPVGGQLNAFTDREVTCYTALVLHEHVPLALEVLSDMICHSLIASEELAREKNVVLEEIRAIEDAPEDMVHDVFVSTIWPGHPMGRPVIGHVETVASFTREAVLDYMRQQYTPDSILIAAAGNLCHQRVVEESQRCMGQLEGRRNLQSVPPPQPQSSSVVLYRKTEQAHLCLGAPAFPQQDPDNYAAVIIDTVLGGGPHSRLFDEIRENRGLAYSVGSSLAAFSDAGLFTAYASTSPKNVNEVIRIIRDLIAQIATEGLAEDEIELARQHLRASMILAHESTGSRMGRIANSQLYFGRIIPFQEVIERLDAVTAEDIRRVAGRLFHSSNEALTVIGPIRPGSKQAQRLSTV